MVESITVEIISVRLCDPDNQKEVQEIFDQLNPVLGENADHLADVELYLNMKDKTDWSIYLHWLQLAPKESKTVLGLNIAEAFSALGLVNHTLWTRDQIHTQHKRQLSNNNLV